MGIEEQKISETEAMEYRNLKERLALLVDEIGRIEHVEYVEADEDAKRRGISKENPGTNLVLERLHGEALEEHEMRRKILNAVQSNLRIDLEKERKEGGMLQSERLLAQLCQRFIDEELVQRGIDRITDPQKRQQAQDSLMRALEDGIRTQGIIRQDWSEHFSDDQARSGFYAGALLAGLVRGMSGRLESLLAAAGGYIPPEHTSTDPEGIRSATREQLAAAERSIGNHLGTFNLIGAWTEEIGENRDEVVPFDRKRWRAFGQSELFTRPERAYVPLSMGADHTQGSLA